MEDKILLFLMQSRPVVEDYIKKMCGEITKIAIPLGTPATEWITHIVGMVGLEFSDCVRHVFDNDPKVRQAFVDAFAISMAPTLDAAVEVTKQAMNPAAPSNKPSVN